VVRMAHKKVILMADGAVKMKKKEPSQEVVNYVKTHSPSEPTVAKATETRKLTDEEAAAMNARGEAMLKQGITQVKTSSYTAKDMSGRVVEARDSISVRRVEKHPTTEEKVKAFVEEHGVEALNRPLIVKTTEVKKQGVFGSIRTGISNFIAWGREKPEQALFATGTGLAIGSLVTRQIGYEIVRAYVQGIVQGGGPDVISTLAQSGAQVPLQVVAAASLYVGSELAVTAGAVAAAVGLVLIAGRGVWNRLIEPLLNRGEPGKKTEA